MTAPKTRILICDDEPHLREMVGEFLEERGYQPVEAEGATELFSILAGDGADLVILDINMPGDDGLTALKQLREESTVPVIMLTAASEVIDRVVGLELGADDYLGKPVDLRELEARIKAALRRTPAGNNNRKSVALKHISNLQQVGKCKLDLDGAKLFDADENEIQITAMEFSLLKVFCANRGRVLNRDQLLDQAHDRGWEPFDRSIDLRISRLRRKIEKNPSKPEAICTVRGVGYIFH